MIAADLAALVAAARAHGMQSLDLAALERLLDREHARTEALRRDLTEMSVYPLA